MQRVLLFLFCFIYLISNAEPLQKKKQAQNDILRLEDSLESLKREILLLKEKSEWKNEVLEERLKQASDTISNQQSLFGGFSMIYTIITIMIALIGIVLPVLTYQYGIKPARDALSDFEINSEKMMEDYLKKTRVQQIDQAIENIKGKDQELKANAINYISLTQHQDFTNDQVLKFVKLLESDVIDATSKNSISWAIANKKNEYATEYFKLAIKEQNLVNFKYAAIKYFINTGIENNLPIFRDTIEAAHDKQREFFTILSFVANTDKNSLLILINDKECINKLNQTDFRSLKNTLGDIAQGWPVTTGELWGSYLNRQVQSSAS